MREYHCPNCGRFLLASDAPAGYRVRLPRCQGCGERPPLLRFEQDASPGGPAPVAARLLAVVR
jgi:DNA-directed RNA polymerase subunit RPC12/RpoP